VSGGRSTDTDLWSNAEYTLNVDTQKAGLWPGGFLKLQGNTSFGFNVNHNSGAIVPVNTAALIPESGETVSALMNATFMQFLSEKLGVVIGKFNTFELAETEFYGDYRTQFLNAGFNFPTNVYQVPISAWGGGVIALPSKDLVLSVLEINPNGTATTNPVFSGGAMVTGSAQLTVKMGGLVGHQQLGFAWNNKERYSLEQDPSNITRLLLFSQFPRLENPGPDLEAILKQYFPGLLVPTVPPNMKSSSWSGSYNFDQYFWQPQGKPDQGVGVFFAWGFSDGNPNIIKNSFLFGIGGKGVVPGRDKDTFGIGFASTQFSSAFVPFLREHLDIGLEHENAFEAYYNAALTGWLNLTADVQVVQPGLTKTLNGMQLANVDNAVVVGLRLRARF
jgi:porin